MITLISKDRKLPQPTEMPPRPTTPPRIKKKINPKRIFMDSYNSPSTKPLYRGTQIVWYILGLLEVILAFRFVLKLFGANSAAGFTSFIYGITRPFAAPFLSVFKITDVNGSIFEWTTLLAMLVYWLIAWGIVKLFLMGKTVSTPEAAVKLDNQDK
jgi:hypothetical protein